MATDSSVFGSAVVPFRLTFLMWATFYLESFIHLPLIHVDIFHLISNTLPLLFLGSVLFFFYEKIGGIVFFRAYFWTNILVWLFARPAVHIGASGVVYALAFFLMFFGFFRR